jgi:hypothetical protein
MLNGAKIENKGAKPRFMDKDLYEKSSDVLTYNLFDQNWQTLQAHGLTHLFKDKTDFETRKAERAEGIGEEEAEPVT